MGNAIGFSLFNSNTKNIKYGYNPIPTDDEYYYMQRLDLEREFELGVNKLLDRIIDAYDPTIQEHYKELIQTYGDNKKFPLSYKLTTLYRVVYRLLSIQANSELCGFITNLRNIYASGDLVQLTDEELLDLNNNLISYLKTLDKQKG